MVFVGLDAGHFLQGTLIALWGIPIERSHCINATVLSKIGKSLVCSHELRYAERPNYTQLVEREILYVTMRIVAIKSTVEPHDGSRRIPGFSSTSEVGT